MSSWVEFPATPLSGKETAVPPLGQEAGRHQHTSPLSPRRQPRRPRHRQQGGTRLPATAGKETTPPAAAPRGNPTSGRSLPPHCRQCLWSIQQKNKGG